RKMIAPGFEKIEGRGSSANNGTERIQTIEQSNGAAIRVLRSNQHTRYGWQCAAHQEGRDAQYGCRHYEANNTSPSEAHCQRSPYRTINLTHYPYQRWS